MPAIAATSPMESGTTSIGPALEVTTNLTAPQSNLASHESEAPRQSKIISPHNLAYNSLNLYSCFLTSSRLNSRSMRVSLKVTSKSRIARSSIKERSVSRKTRQKLTIQMASLCPSQGQWKPTRHTFVRYSSSCSKPSQPMILSSCKMARPARRTSSTSISRYLRK